MGLPTPLRPACCAQAIVLLAGMVAPPDEFQPRPVLSDETVTRCLKAAQLYQESGPRLIVVSGGKVDSSKPGPTCARAMADFLMGLGVEPRDLVTEERSRTTHENAVETGRLLAARGIQHIVLVTSATHMPRAERCFRARIRRDCSRLRPSSDRVPMVRPQFPAQLAGGCQPGGRRPRVDWPGVVLAAGETLTGEYWVLTADC